ncbi:maltotransferase domain-containing protein, partial [Streptomyces sp. NPDC004376]
MPAKHHTPSPRPTPKPTARKPPPAQRPEDTDPGSGGTQRAKGVRPGPETTRPETPGSEHAGAEHPGARRATTGRAEAETAQAGTPRGLPARPEAQTAPAKATRAEPGPARTTRVDAAVRAGASGSEHGRSSSPHTEPVAERPPAPAAGTAVRPPVLHAEPPTVVGRIPVLDVRPVVQHGRRPAKAVVGETFQVSATVFREGHDAVNANVVLRGPDGRTGPWAPMRELAPGTDRWGADVSADATGRWTYTVEAWSDPIATWRHTAGIKVPAGIDTALVLDEGARLHERAADGVPEERRKTVLEAATALRAENRPASWRLAAALAPEVLEVLERYPLRELVTASDPMPLLVERERALYGSWYEFFPRSEGTPEQPHGTFRTAERRLEAIAEMGFDVVYLPPIHPIGTTHRKGRNNTLTATPDDVGVPWAIGSPEGGHDSVHPQLGTLEDFDHFVNRARELGLEVALDFALQCSPDHP